MQQESNGERRAALVFLAFGVLSFGLSGVLVKLCRYPPAVVASFRMILAGAVLAPFCLRAWRGFLAERGGAGVLPLLVPGILLGLHFHLWVAGLEITSVANATFIFSINPVFFALAERFVGRRRVPPYALLALSLGLAGAGWLLFVEQGSPAGGASLRGDLLCLLATLLFVAYLFVSRWATQRPVAQTPCPQTGKTKTPPTQRPDTKTSPARRAVAHHLYIHIVYLGGGLATLPIALMGRQLAEVSLRDGGSLLALAALALLPTLVGHTANNYAVRFLPPLTVSFFTLAEPILATAAAAVVLAEVPGVKELPAYILFLAATLFYLARSRGRPLESLPEPDPGGATSDRKTGSSR